MFISSIRVITGLVMILAVLQMLLPKDDTYHMVRLSLGFVLLLALLQPIVQLVYGDAFLPLPLSFDLDSPAAYFLEQGERVHEEGKRVFLESRRRALEEEINQFLRLRQKGEARVKIQGGQLRVFLHLNKETLDTDHLLFLMEKELGLSRTLFEIIP